MRSWKNAIILHDSGMTHDAMLFTRVIIRPTMPTPWLVMPAIIRAAMLSTLAIRVVMLSTM